MDWLYLAFLQFVLTCMVVLAVSTMAPQAAAAKLTGLTRDTITAEQHAEVKASYNG